MWKVMVSRELSVGKLVVTYLVCVLAFGVLCLGFTRIGVETRLAIAGGVIYAIVIALCLFGFAVDWDIAIPNFRAWKETRKLAK
jgi:membrane associated rhomboid family serine protease